MPDIQLRFQRDMLVLSAPIDAMLAQQGINAALDRQYLNLMEPDAIRDALKLEVLAGAQCIVATTEDITQARLAHLRMDSDASRLANAALEIANEVQPQHILAEIGPCGLPLDASSKSSLNENRQQYAGAARACADGTFDAFFLNGFSDITDLKCALMGVAQVNDKPIFASVTVGSAPIADAPEEPVDTDEPSDVIKGMAFDLPLSAGYSIVDDQISPPVPAALRSSLNPELFDEALDVMVDLGASVVGFETADSIALALEYAEKAARHTQLPILAQLRVTKQPDTSPRRNLVPLDSIDEYTPDTMAGAAVKLFGAGVQFLRASGIATPAYTGALASTTAGLDVRQRS